MTLDAFLEVSGWGGATQSPMTPDASSRSYMRLRQGRETAILMRDPEGDVAVFARLAEHLVASGLSAPRILAMDAPSGLLLAEDLGDALFDQLSAGDPTLEITLYTTAAQALAHLHRAAPPYGLTVATPDLMADMIAPFFDEFLRNSPCTRAQRQALTQPVLQALNIHAAQADVMVLRDYHAQNLLWLPQRQSVRRAGLLDFQDALIGHMAYDLASLLQDARRDVRPDAAKAARKAFLEATGASATTLDAAMAVLGLQRNLRILGIFHRLARVRGKPGYLRLIPRVTGHIGRAVQHKALHDVIKPLQSLLPQIAP